MIVKLSDLSFWIFGRNMSFSKFLATRSETSSIWNSGESGSDGSDADQNLRELLARRKKLEKLMLRPKIQKERSESLTITRPAGHPTSLARNLLTELVYRFSIKAGAYIGIDFIAVNA